MNQGGAPHEHADDKPAFPDTAAGFNVKRENVPHGKVTTVRYDAKSLGTHCQIRVHTPSAYSANRKYPVLILLQGIGGNDLEWTKSSHADNILDNLLAGGKIQPMVVVFPNDGSRENGAAGKTNVEDLLRIPAHRPRVAELAATLA